MPGLKAVGSYRSVLELLNIPHAKLIMDCVILLSVTSCLNSALYTASRMLYSLSRRGDAPAVMGKINRSKTPYVAVLLSTGAAFLTVVVNYYAPAKVFKFLIDSSGAIALLVYLVIAVSQLRMRKILRAEGSEIRLRIWLYPCQLWLAGKSWYCGKKHPFIIRADHDQESHHDHYVSGWLSLAEERYYSR